MGIDRRLQDSLEDGYDGVFPQTLPTGCGRHLIALDIDGTTVHHDGSLSAAVATAVREVVDAGHEVVIATGRSLLATLPVVAALGLQEGYLVCSNGAVVAALDPQEELGARLLAVSTFDPAPALTLLREVCPEAHVAVEEVGIGFKVVGEFAPEDLHGQLRQVDWAELLDGPVTRVTFSHPTGTAEEFVDMVGRVGLHGVNYAVGYTAWLDLTPEGVSKASGLEQVRQWLDVAPGRTVAVGDQRNDLEMLSWAACGVAMRNAPPEVRSVADLVTGHVDDDGLVQVLAAVPALCRRPCCA